MAQRNFPRFRLLPITLLVILFVFGVRILDAVTLLASGEGVSMQAANAQTKAPPTSAAGKPEAAAPKTGQTAEAPPALPAPDGKSPVQPASVPAGAKPSAAPSGAPSGRSSPDNALSTAEVDLLQSLSQRRNDLDQRAQTLEQREALLRVGEERLTQKVAELTALRGELEKLLNLRKTKEEQELTNLVKIYEAMKPREAAVIFDGLDTPVLLDVVERMKEQKTAPVLAAMNPQRAREVTTRLADRRKLPPAPAAAIAAATQPAGMPAPAAAAPAQPATAQPASAQPGAKPAANAKKP